MLVFRASYALVYARGSECWGGLRSLLLLLFSLFILFYFLREGRRVVESLKIRDYSRDNAPFFLSFFFSKIRKSPLL